MTGFSQRYRPNLKPNGFPTVLDSRKLYGGFHCTVVGIYLNLALSYNIAIDLINFAYFSLDIVQPLSEIM